MYFCDEEHIMSVKAKATYESVRDAVNQLEKEGKSVTPTNVLKLTGVNATPKCPIFDIRKCHSTLKFLISENVNLNSRG